MQATDNTSTIWHTHLIPSPQRNNSGNTSTERAFCLEALAPYLADLKLQIALRQAMS